MAPNIASGRSSPPLVGRGPQLSVYDRALQHVEAGAARVIAVAGEPGIGKSRLLEEVRARAVARGHLALGGRADEFESDLPFAVWVDALDDYVAAVALHEDAAFAASSVLAEAATVLPALRGHADERPHRRLHDERYRIHAAMRILLERLAVHAPLVLTLDDLHWADAGSLELLSALLRRPPGAPMLLALAFRPRQLPERFAAMLVRAERDGALERLELEPLDEAAARTLLAGKVEDALLARIHAESGGNPFYLEQLSRSAARRPGPRGGGAPATLAGVPPAVATALADELRDLQDEMRALLDAASVAGDPFDPDLVAAIAERPEQEVLSVLDSLVAADLVRATDAPRRFAFRHPLVRRAVYEATPAGWRLAAHQRAAAALAAVAAPPSVLAHHVEQSARSGDAEAVAILAAAGAAASGSSPASALHWFEAALRLLPGDPQHTQSRVELMLNRATALAAVGRFGDCWTTLVQVLELLPPGALAPRVQLVAFCSAIEHLLGRHEQAHARLVATFEALPDHQAPEAVDLMLELGSDAFYHADFREMEDWGVRARDGAEVLGSGRHGGAASALLALANVFTGRVEQADECRRAAAPRLDALSDEELATRLSAPLELAWAELYLERFEDAVAHAQRGIAVSRASGQGQLVSMMTQVEGLALVGLSRAVDGMELLAAAVESARLTDNPQALSLALLNYALGAVRSGDPDAALPAAEEAAEVVRGLDESVLAGFAGAVLALASVECEEPARAADMLLAAAGGAHLPRLPAPWRPLFFDALARAEIARGALPAAGAAAENAAELARQLGLALADAQAKRAAAAVALARGEPHEAAELAQAAVRRASAHEAGRFDAARASILVGQALAAGGARDRAVTELRAAIAQLESLGAARTRDQAVRELRRLGRRHRPLPAAAGAAGLDALSEREREVAELVTGRRMNKEIAAALYLSEKTVESHLRNVFAKLDVRSRMEVARAVERARRGSGGPSPTGQAPGR
jgi:DNA-binding NarL/FixJ family response regulator